MLGERGAMAMGRTEGESNALREMESKGKKIREREDKERAMCVVCVCCVVRGHVVWCGKCSVSEGVS